MSGASEEVNGGTSSAVLTSGLLVVLDSSSIMSDFIRRDRQSSIIIPLTTNDYRVERVEKKKQREK